MKYDTIIIGAGLSGLAAGIRLAYFDKRVCIVERHTTIGGLNSFYRLRKRDYDVGLHAVTNYADKGAKGKPLTKLLRQLRLSWDDFSLCPQIESAVIFPDCRLRVSNDFDLLTSQVAENFPAQIDGFRRLVGYIDDYDPFASTEGYQSARQLVQSYISDSLLENMLFCPILFYSSATPNDLDVRQFVIIFRSILQEGFARPYEGIRRILKVLVKKFRGEGGELKLRTGVKQILHNEQGAYGIETESGEILEADNILSSAGLVETQRLCDQQFVSEDKSTGQISFVESISSLDCPPAELGHQGTVIFFSTQTDFRYENPPTPVDLRSGIICSPNNYQFEQPLEHSKINITALADFHYWLALEDEELYQSEKQKQCKAMIDNAVKIVPDFRDHIIDQDVFTPRTIRKFTGHINGAVYGSPTKQLSGTTPVPHLYLCGTDQGFLGIIGSMLSGISMANAHLLK